MLPSSVVYLVFSTLIECLFCSVTLVFDELCMSTHWISKGSQFILEDHSTHDSLFLNGCLIISFMFVCLDCINITICPKTLTTNFCNEISSKHTDCIQSLFCRYFLALVVLFFVNVLSKIRKLKLNDLSLKISQFY